MASSRRVRWPGFSIWSIGVICLLLAVTIPVSRRFFLSVINGVATAVQRMASSVSGDWLPGGGGNIRQERDALRAQVARLSLTISAQQSAQETAQSVAQLESYIAGKKFQAVTASVIGFSPDPGIQSIVLGKGSHDGVRTGLAVVAGNGVMIGTVSRVHELTSTVLLLVDNHSAIAARVQNDPQSLGLVQGERGLSLNMDFIPRNDTVASGQTVVTSGSDPNIPPDILIGPIQSVTTHPGDLFQQAVISVIMPYTRISEASIILR